MLIITASAVIPSLRPALCEGTSCPPATGFQYFVLFGSLYLISIGTGGVKSALLPFGADQYNDSNLEESKNKQLFFSWFFMAVNLGVFISGTVLVWIQQNVAWSLGFGISSMCLVIATVAFLVGTPVYRVQLPTGSPLKSLVMVFVASLKKRKMAVPADRTLLFEGGDAESSSIVPNKLEHTDEFRYIYHFVPIMDFRANTTGKVDLDLPFSLIASLVPTKSKEAFERYKGSNLVLLTRICNYAG